jgi:hypothetical protein
MTSFFLLFTTKWHMVDMQRFLEMLVVCPPLNDSGFLSFTTKWHVSGMQRFLKTCVTSCSVGYLWINDLCLHYHKNDFVRHCPNINRCGHKIQLYCKMHEDETYLFKEAVTINCLTKYIYGGKNFIYWGGQDCPSHKTNLREAVKIACLVKSIYSDHL